MLGFLFVEEDEFGRDADDVAKVLNDDGRAVVAGLVGGARGAGRLDDRGDRGGAAGRSSSRSSASSRATRSARSASPITGRRISPPLFESLELLGRERSLSRLASALA